MYAKALLIDFGGTLDADGEPWVDRFLRAYGEAGGTSAPAVFRTAFAASDALLAGIDGVREFNYSETVEAQTALLAALLPDGDRLTAPVMRDQLVGEALAVAARNRPVLVALQSEGFRLAVVSNYQGNLEPCLAELGLVDLFAAISDSELIGTRKPDRRIFDATLAALDCRAAESWMIGDSPPNDIVAAAALGMRTCWVAPPARAAVGITPTARVARFDQLPLVLAA